MKHGGTSGAANLKLEPHSGRIFIDSVGTEQVITDAVCLRQSIVPGHGPWDIVFDDEGFGALVSEHPGEEVRLLEHFLGRSLYTSDSGQLFMLTTDIPSCKDAEFENLSQKMRSYTKGVVSLTTPDAELTFDVFYLDWPRGGFHLQWSIGQAYDNLKMKSYKGQRSKWIFGSWSRWGEIMQELAESNHFLKGVACTPVQLALTDGDAFLPSSSTSTLALVVLLCRWCRAPPTRGGLRESEPRRRSEVLLRSLVRGCHAVGSQMNIEFLEQYQWRWPRPDMKGGLSMKLDVNSDGLVDLKQWRSACDADKDVFSEAEIVQRRWFRDFCTELAGQSGLVDLGALLLDSGVLYKDGGQALWMQIVHFVASRLECVYLMSRRSSASHWVFKASAMEISASWDAREVDKEVMNFVAASKFATKGFVSAGVAIDKVAGRGLSLQNGIMCLPNNVAFEMVPQAGDGRLLGSPDQPVRPTMCWGLGNQDDRRNGLACHLADYVAHCPIGIHSLQPGPSIGQISRGALVYMPTCLPSLVYMTPWCIRRLVSPERLLSWCIYRPVCHFPPSSALWVPPIYTKLVGPFPQSNSGAKSETPALLIPRLWAPARRTRRRTWRRWPRTPRRGTSASSPETLGSGLESDTEGPPRRFCRCWTTRSG